MESYLRRLPKETFHEVLQCLAVSDVAKLDSAATNKVFRSFLHENVTKATLINSMDPVELDAVKFCVQRKISLTGVVNFCGIVDDETCEALNQHCLKLATA